MSKIDQRRNSYITIFFCVCSNTNSLYVLSVRWSYESQPNSTMKRPLYWGRLTFSWKYDCLNHPCPEVRNWSLFSWGDIRHDSVNVLPRSHVRQSSLHVTWSKVIWFITSILQRVRASNLEGLGHTLPPATRGWSRWFYFTFEELQQRSIPAGHWKTFLGTEGHLTSHGRMLILTIWPQSIWNWHKVVLACEWSGSIKSALKLIKASILTCLFSNLEIAFCLQETCDLLPVTEKQGRAKWELSLALSLSLPHWSRREHI